MPFPRYLSLAQNRHFTHRLAWVAPQRYVCPTSLLRCFLLRNRKFSFFARVVTNVKAVADVTILFEPQRGVTVKRNVQCGVGSPHIDCSIIELERVNRLVPVWAMAAPFVDLRNLDQG